MKGAGGKEIMRGSYAPVVGRKPVVYKHPRPAPVKTQAKVRPVVRWKKPRAAVTMSKAKAVPRAKSKGPMAAAATGFSPISASAAAPVGAVQPTQQQQLVSDYAPPPPQPGWSWLSVINSVILVGVLGLLIVLVVTRDDHTHSAMEARHVVGRDGGMHNGSSLVEYEFKLQGPAKTFNRYPPHRRKGDGADLPLYAGLKWENLAPHDCCCTLHHVADADGDEGDYHFCAQGQQGGPLGLGLECVLKKNPSGEGVFLLAYHEADHMLGAQCRLRWRP